MKKKSEMSEDEQKTSEKNIQDMLDKFIKEVDVVTAKKEKDIMEI
jgi:ribosome recycling factor